MMCRSEMTPTEKIDAALDAVFKAGGMFNVLDIESLPFHESLDRMRETMRKIMAESYLAGSYDAHEAMKGK